MLANAPQIKKSSGNKRRYAVSVEFLGAFHPIKFQAQAYCSLNYLLNFIFLGSFLLAT